MKRLSAVAAGTVLAAAVVAGVSGVGEGKGPGAVQWRITPTQQPVLADSSFALFNLDAKKCLAWTARRFGINLAYLPKPVRCWRFVREDSSAGPLQYGQVFALKEKTGGYLYHVSRKAGVDLGWSKQPVYEWECRGGEPGTVIGAGPGPYSDVSLFNRKAGYPLVYGERGPGVNLVWAQ